MDGTPSYDTKQHERIAEILYDVARVTDLPQDSSQIYSRLKHTIRDMRTVLRAVANCEYRMEGHPSWELWHGHIKECDDGKMFYPEFVVMLRKCEECGYVERREDGSFHITEKGMEILKYMDEEALKEHVDFVVRWTMRR